MLTLKQINAATHAEFTALLDGVYGQAPWIAGKAWTQRPFASLAQLKRALVEVLRGSAKDAQLALIRAHPALDVAAVSPADAAAEPAVEADDPSAAPATSGADAALRQLAADYAQKFDFPFVLATAGPRGGGLSQEQILATLERRFAQPAEIEFAEALRQIHRIAELRLAERFGAEPELGNRVCDWAETLAAHSDPGFAEQGRLTVTYLSDAHRACAAQIEQWMRKDCGFDEVAIDAVGNVVGVYHGSDEQAPRLLTGSHYDTVRNAGRYDGRLGILVPMVAVRELSRTGRRLSHGIEVVGFAEEEGQRFKACFLGSGALTGHFDMAGLDQLDAAGVSLREAMQQAGLRIADIPALKRDPARYLGFVEMHIEQGPVLCDNDMPLGIVTAINGGLRVLGQVIGIASHAGTTPMGQRRDAATAVAELALFLETRAAAVPDLVGTMGLLTVPDGSINVVPGRCRFSLDIRATSDEVRDACADEVLAELAAICGRRGLRFEVEETLRAAAAASAPDWQQRWEAAVSSLGLPVMRLPSGAGHDARQLHRVMPQAMLFQRGENAGISHNPLESVTNDDTELSVRAFLHLLDNLALPIAADPGAAAAT